MDINETQHEAVTVFELTGRLDANAAKLWQDKILAAIDGGAAAVVVDLSHLAYISSAGLRVFLLAAKQIKNANGKMVLCALGEFVHQVFEIAGFMSLFAIYATQDDALKQFA